MKTTDYALWMQTRAGRRIHLASSSSQAVATLVGEAVWTHVCMHQATTLDVWCLEVLEGCSSCEPGSLPSMPRIIARWSGAGHEKPPPSSTAPSVPETAGQGTFPLSYQCLSGDQGAEPSGLTTSFLTAEERAHQNTWRPEL